MISVEYKTDLGPDIAKDLNEIYCCLNTIYSSRSCQQTRRNSANRVRQQGRGDKIVPIHSEMKISAALERVGKGRSFPRSLNHSSFFQGMPKELQTPAAASVGRVNLFGDQYVQMLHLVV